MVPYKKRCTALAIQTPRTLINSEALPFQVLEIDAPPQLSADLSATALRNAWLSRVPESEISHSDMTWLKSELPFGKDLPEMAQRECRSSLQRIVLVQSFFTLSNHTVVHIVSSLEIVAVMIAPALCLGSWGQNRD